MRLTLRPAGDDDIEAVIALWRDCGSPVPARQSRDAIAFCRRTGNADLLVGTVDGRIAVAAMVGHDGYRGWLRGLAVAPALRGRGLGRAAVAAVERWMLARDVPELALVTGDGTDAGPPDFWTHLGYRAEAGTIMARRFLPAPPTGAVEVPVTVTYLEMLAPPPRPAVPAPLGMPVALVRARPPSPRFYRYLYDNVGAAWTWVYRRTLDDEALQAIIEDEKVEIHVLHVAGVPAGYGELNRGLRAGEVEISYFGLMPEYIGRGLGWYFLNAIIDLAWLSEPRRVVVDTCDLDHPRAIANYQRAGFRPYRQATQTLPDPRTVGLPLPRRREDC